MRASANSSVTPQDLARCSSAFTDRLEGARALAVAFVRKGASERREIAGASVGASVEFTDLCLALAEAPVGSRVHEIDVAGFGRVSWQAAHFEAERDADFVVFALQS
ncbi:MAG: hypothetical protein JNL81_15235 [Hyphomonadaceae bacterium]|nr:hypothetical protein [Hyphomonadaceae bacterium]